MVEVDFDVKQILQDRLASSMGLDKYKNIIETFRKVNVSKDREFQRVFNGFYLIRRNEQWRNIYYDYFESAKNKRKVSFEEILTYLFVKTGNIEPSFSSKMLATLDSNSPIWDQYVLQNLQLQLSGKTKEERLANAIILYQEITVWYQNFLKTEKATECIQAFDFALPDYAWISDCKKVDTLLWSMR